LSEEELESEVGRLISSEAIPTEGPAWTAKRVVELDKAEAAEILAASSADMDILAFSFIIFSLVSFTDRAS
jgi:hypothetical protein